jgi:GrpB-like predicted nucleotidyltransferase (UPF0157 family)
MNVLLLISDPQFQERADLTFERCSAELRQLLPFAEIEHIGSTAIPGTLTKGDLDILVRVSTSEQLVRADELLAQRYQRNTGSDRNFEFSSFKNEDLDPPLGIQVVLKDSAYDQFIKFRDLLRASPALVKAFNDLKAKFEGCSMDEYRTAKTGFIQSILSGELR